MGGSTEKRTFFNLMLSLLSDHIQENTVEKDFQILIKSNFIYIYIIIRGKDKTKI